MTEGRFILADKGMFSMIGKDGKYYYADCEFTPDGIVVKGPMMIAEIVNDLEDDDPDDWEEWESESA